MADKKAEDLGSAFVTVFFLALAVGGVMWVHGFLWGEQEGLVRTTDCRKVIPVKEDSSDTWFKKFTCTYEKTKSGKIFGGTCAAVVTDGVACEAAYVYDKKPPTGCTDPKFPYPGRDDLCHTDVQY